MIGAWSLYAYSSTTKRQVNGNSTMQVEVIYGVAGVNVSLQASHIASSTAVDDPIAEIGVDSTTVNSGLNAYVITVAGSPINFYATYEDY